MDAALPLSTELDRPNADLRIRAGWAAAVLVISAFFLFTQLGHYGLWDDESLTAITGLSFWQSGTFSARLGHNILGYDNGILLKNLHDCFQPPLQMIVEAPFVGILGNTSFAARLPFAICGLACTAFLIGWLIKSRASLLTAVLFSLGLLLNVSYFLYFRQARYYGLSHLASVVIIYLYVSGLTSRRRLIGFAFWSIVLLLSNYIQFVAIYVCIALDYFVWGRKENRLKVGELAAVLIPQLLVGIWILVYRNPADPQMAAPHHGHNTISEKLLLFWWFLRDLDTNEMGVLIVLAMAPLLYGKTRNPWYLRAPLCLVLYLLVLAWTSPTSVHHLPVAEIRYAAPLIPLCIFIEVLVLSTLAHKSKRLAIAIAIVMFGTNVLNVTSIGTIERRLTVAKFAGELLNPPSDPYALAADWIGANLKENQTLRIVPTYSSYPLMFAQPKPIYGWQFAPREWGMPQGLEAIQYVGREQADYLMVFGLDRPSTKTVVAELADANSPYRRIATIDVAFRDVHRPELYWRFFEGVKDYRREFDCIYVYRQNVRAGFAESGSADRRE